MSKTQDWEKRFDEKFLYNGEPKPYPTIPKGSFLFTARPDSIKDFIRKEKEQSEKEVLEKIKNHKFNTYTATQELREGNVSLSTLSKKTVINIEELIEYINNENKN